MTQAPEQMERVRQVELVISTILRVGVILSLSIVVLGMLLSFVHHPDYRHSAEELAKLTRPGAAFPRTLAEVAASIGRLEGRGVVTLGLLLLIATPVVRVAVSILAFHHQRDRVFVAITTTVLILLIASFFLGRGGG